MKSLFAYFISIMFISYLSCIYYPRWEHHETEGAFGWDISGYYMYLPALFIYHDIKQLQFDDEIWDKYHWTPEFKQSYKLENGNKVIKYSGGMALMYLPSFLVAHLIAHLFDYPADGFSPPYQVSILVGGVIMAFIGLWFLRKNLLKRYSDGVTAVVLLILVFGTNYLESSAFGSAWTHNWLFTVYVILIFVTDRFYEKPTLIRAIIIGGLVGLATLTRPTDIISVIIPLLWGVESVEGIKERWTFFRQHSSKVISALISCIAIASIQVVYWKYVSDGFFVYSYQGQGFSWLNPHIIDGVFSYKQGWLVYTPIMIFSLIGFWFLRKYDRPVFIASLTFAGVFIYITFAWDEWWYGGGLSQRAMVQSYAVLAFPLACSVEYFRRERLRLAFFIGVCLIFCYYNLWLTYQAHGNGLLRAGAMTKAYFWKILGRYEVDENAEKLLDTDEEFTGERRNVKKVFEEDFEGEEINTCGFPAIDGTKSLCLDKDTQASPMYSIPIQNDVAEWMRISALFQCKSKEWNVWKMTQLIVRFNANGNTVKGRMIRVQRLLHEGEIKKIFLDVKLPKQDFDSVQVSIWNSGSDKQILIDDLVVETFDENKRAPFF